MIKIINNNMNKIFLIVLISLSLISCQSTNSNKLNTCLIKGTESLENGNFLEAENFFNQCLIEDKTNEIALNNQIITLFELSKKEEALNLVNYSISIHEENLKFYELKANILKEFNQIEEELQTLKIIIKKVPFSKKYHREYLDRLMRYYKDKKINSTSLIKEEALFLLDHSILRTEALIALCTIEKNSLDYSVALYNENKKAWNEIYK